MSSSASAGFLPPLSRRSSPQGSRANSAEEKQQTSARASRRSSRELGTGRDTAVSPAQKQAVRSEDAGRERQLQAAAAQQSSLSSSPSSSSSSTSPRRSSLPPRLGQARISVPLPRDLIVKAAAPHRHHRPLPSSSPPASGSSPSPAPYDATWERSHVAESGLLHSAAFTRTTVGALMREAERGRGEESRQQPAASSERSVTPSAYAPPPPRASFISPAEPSSLSSSPSSSSAFSVSDSAMISSLTQRVLSLEALSQQQSRQLVAKDSSIRQLEQDLSRASAAAVRAASDGGAEAELGFLRQEQSRLSRQVYEMEQFLADYGMQWVGDEADAATAEDDSPPSASLPFDLPLFQSRIAELNSSLPASTLTVSSSSARFSPPPRLTLTLLSDGIALPPPLPAFLAFSSTSCQRLVRDIMDGYWPGEWRERWPDGVRLELLLRTELGWEDEKRRRERRRQRSFHAFEGEGRRLRDEENREEADAPRATKGEAGQQPQRRQLQSPSTARETASEPRAAPRLRREDFLSRLPSSALSAGRLIDIRGSIALRLQRRESSSAASSVWETLPIKETTLLTSIRSLTSSIRPPFPPAVSPVCVLRVHLHQQRPAASAVSISSSSFLLLFGCHELLESVTVSLLEAVRGEAGMAGRTWRLRWASLYPRAVVELDELPSAAGAAELRLPAADGRRSLSQLRWSPNCAVLVRARVAS